MTEKDFDSVLSDVEKVVKGFKIKKWKNRGLFERFNEVFKMVNSYDLQEEQKVYLFRRGTILLAIEAVHDISPATDYFRKNPAERFLVFRTPGQEGKEGLIDEWIEIQKGNWARQGEAGGEEAANVRAWWT